MYKTFNFTLHSMVDSTPWDLCIKSHITPLLMCIVRDYDFTQGDVNEADKVAQFLTSHSITETIAPSKVEVSAEVGE